MQLSETNDAGVGKTSIVSTNTTEVLELTNTGGGTGVKGNSTGNGEGVWGRRATPEAHGYGVVGQVVGTQGYGVIASGGALANARAWPTVLRRQPNHHRR